MQRVVTGAIAVAMLASGTAAVAGQTGSRTAVAVIVQGPNSATDVRAVGGKTTLALDLIGGVAATVPEFAIARLQSEGLAVSPDVAARVADAGFANPGGDAQNPPAAQPAPVASDAGHGIAVALIDTGVADTPDLTVASGRLVRGPDFSGENDGIDHFGHGTFMAGLIAGDGTASIATGGPLRQGAAPGATLVSIKVAGADGSTSLSRVIAGIGWAVVHQGDLGIRVLSLSLGIKPDSSYLNDPLSAAMEIAWASGLTTVVSAGNDGAGNVTSPGRDPFVLTVGAADNTVSTDPANATMPSWSGSADLRGYDKPNVLASGVSIVSLRAPGSTIDTAYPAARIDNAYFRGSGTSMATALTAGMAAVLTQRHPDSAPDDIKGALVSTATAVPQAGISAGEINLGAALTAQATEAWDQHFKTAVPHLDFAWQNRPWTGGRWSGGRWSGGRWSGGRWSGGRWSAVDWTQVWEGGRWSAVDWSGGRWSGGRWSVAGWGTSQP